MTNKQNNLLSWITRGLTQDPKNKKALIDIIEQATSHEVIDPEALKMMTGVLAVSSIQAHEIMIPRGQMIVIEETCPLADIIPIVTSSRHSRFPVVGESRDQVIGILLAKDLVGINQKTFTLQPLLRPALFIPETKNIDSLLQEFRQSHNHMAVVVDEYGGVTGLITIEDVLEQIVGDIEDEYDEEEESEIHLVQDSLYSVKAQITLEDFNKHFKTNFQAEGCETLAGFITGKLGYLPEQDETININPLRLRINQVDKRRIYTIDVEIVE